MYVPAWVPHREENPSDYEDAVVVLARSTPEEIVIDLPSLWSVDGIPGASESWPAFWPQRSTSGRIGAVTTASLVSPVVVGRQAEAAALSDALARALAGEPVTVLLGGEAGVGKSRLVHELIAEAGEQGARSLSGGCVELDGGGIPLRRGGDAEGAGPGPPRRRAR